MVIKMADRIFVMAVAAVLLAASPCGAQGVVKLDTDSFEHKTQAATGQTTGVWCAGEEG